MRKKTFISFWNLLFYSIISAILIGIFIYIFVWIKGDKNWNDIHWWYALLAAFFIAIPFGFAFLLPRIKIDLNCNKINVFYLVNWKKNSLDINCNWMFYPDQVEKVTLVKLTNEEKKKYTSRKFLFHKYLKIELKYGDIKYLYVSPYLRHQVNQIIKMLTHQS